MNEKHHVVLKHFPCKAKYLLLVIHIAKSFGYGEPIELVVNKCFVILAFSVVNELTNMGFDVTYRVNPNTENSFLNTSWSLEFENGIVESVS